MVTVFLRRKKHPSHGFLISVSARRPAAATRAFVHGCFSRQPTADDFETMLPFNMMVPPRVRAGLSGRPLDA
jgi:hypothetical protein